MVLLTSKIELYRKAPAKLEGLFRDAKSSDDLREFKKAMAEVFAENPDDLLLAAWSYRLDLQPVASEGEGVITAKGSYRHWPAAIIVSLSLGLVYAVFANASFLTPKISTAWYWIGWAPAAAWAILAYLAIVDDRPGRRRFYAYAGLGVAALALASAGLHWRAKGDILVLSALHLPFLVWAIVGASVSLGVKEPAKQFFGYIVKSVEVLLTGVVYWTAGLIFAGLTMGIFSVLHVQLPERLGLWVAAWGVGVIPVVSIASVYIAGKPPSRQEAGMGPATILRVIARLILPLAAVVLVIYLGFIPSNFWRPFREREVLIVYNATVLALIALLTYVVPGPDEQISRGQNRMLRLGVLVASALTFLLNAYSLAAIASRTINSGLTPNRQACLGWNVATLLMLGTLIWSLLGSDLDSWADSFRTWFGRAIILTFVWSLWVLFVLPFI